MRSSETPEGWQKRAEEDTQEATVSPTAKIVGFLLLTALLAGGVAGYIYLGRDSSLAGTLPLPKSIETKTSSHDDLMRLGRELDELATDAQERLSYHDAAAKKAARHLRERLDTLHEAGREMEPKLSREETRTLMAFEEAETIIGKYIEESMQGVIDDDQLNLAKKQLESGLEVGRGKEVDKVILSKLTKKIGNSEGVQDLREVQAAGKHLRLLPEDE